MQAGLLMQVSARHLETEYPERTEFAATLALSLSRQACNTTAGIGSDVSAGADAVTDSAEKNKNY